MIAHGVLPAGKGNLDVDDCRERYIRHLRERTAGRASNAADGENLDLVADRARLAKARADGHELKRATSLCWHAGPQAAHAVHDPAAGDRLAPDHRGHNAFSDGCRLQWREASLRIS